MSDQADLSPLAQALGRVPTGLYIVTTKQGDAPLGFVGSFVMQQGFAPPCVSVAIGRDRDHLTAIRDSKRFAISILDGSSAKVMSAFFKKYEDGLTPFDAIACEDSPGGVKVATDALAWLDCEYSGEYDGGGDHVVVFGTVTDGRQLRNGDPTTHLRKNGLGY